MKYLGLELENPIVAASSPLTSSVERIGRLAEAGVGAVVLKSVFEEQIAGEAAFRRRYNDSPEADDYLREYLGEDYLRGHLELIEGARKVAGVPVIASINCVGAGAWVDYARRIEQAGADALQLNIAVLPASAAESAAEVEGRYLDVVAAVAGAVQIPLSVKLGPRFTNIVHLCREIYYRGAKGVVLFNRFYEPDIQTDTMTIESSDSLSEHSELRNGLRPVALVASEVEPLDVAAATGIHTGDDVVKALLAGAHAVEVCTALYRDGLGVVGAMKRDLAAWMSAHSFGSVDDFRGRLTKPLATFDRLQYMKFFPGTPAEAGATHGD
jgi:dihydroorotate dehydrogenase (fumarate)